MSSLFAWGYNLSRQLGLGDTTNRLVPTQVPGDWRAVSAGGSHTLGIKSDGTLWAWGLNSSGQLGQGDTGIKTTILQVGTANDWVSVDASRANFSAAIKADGTLWMWGENSLYELGLGTNTDRTSPAQVGAATNWVKVSGGYQFTLALNSVGEIWAWGQNAGGQLGQGDTLERATPVLVGSGYADVSAGYYFSAAITAGGDLRAWGQGANYALGLGDTLNRLVPTLVSSGGWVSVSARNPSCAIRGSGDAAQIWTWGVSSEGGLGRGTVSISSTPGLVLSPAGGWRAIAANSHMLAIDGEGTLHAWGNGGDGQLGQGDTAHRFVPSRVKQSKAWGQFSVGERHSMALADPVSTFWRNFFGQSETP